MIHLMFFFLISTFFFIHKPSVSVWEQPPSLSHSRHPPTLTIRSSPFYRRNSLFLLNHTSVWCIKHHRGMSWISWCGQILVSWQMCQQKGSRIVQLHVIFFLHTITGGPSDWSSARCQISYFFRNVWLWLKPLMKL